MRIVGYNELSLAKRDYGRDIMERQAIISENRSRRMRKVKREPLLVPDKPEPFALWIAYDADGTFGGVLTSPEECPEGYHVVVEAAQCCH